MRTWFVAITIGILAASVPPVTAQTDPGAGQDPVTGEVTTSETNNTETRDGADRGPTGSTRNFNVVTTRGGRAEFIAIGPASQAAAAADALTALGGRLLRFRAYPALNRRALIFDLQSMSLQQARDALARNAPQTFIDQHMIYRFAKGKPRLYAADMIGLSAPNGCRLPPVRIGIIDGPVDASHPSLRSARMTVSSVLTSAEKPPDGSHGTAVASLIVGQDSGGALNGFAAGAQLFAVTAFAREKRGPGADIGRIGAALDYLIANNVRLINMSFAGPANSAFDSLLDSAAQRGALMIAAAGNDGQALAAWPAAARSVIAVTAVDAAGRRYRAANTGAHIEFAAPGVDLYVARRRGGAYASGTSYAAPIITALAARLVADGARTLPALRAGLRQKTSDLGIPGRDSDFGWGLVRAGGC